jgi:hypothetical protein
MCKRTNNRILLYSSVVALSLAACAKKSSTEESASTSVALAALPKATAPVVGNSGSALGVESFAATTGIALKASGVAANWTSKSREACEVAQATREIFSEAMSPDKIGCYMGAVLKNNKFSGANVLSGDYVYFKLQNMGEGGGGGGVEPRVKMKAVLTNGVVTTFEMFSCFSASGSTPIQSEYLSVVNSDSDVTLTSKYIGSESGNSYGSSISAVGEINSSGQWLSKTINAQKFWNGGSNGAFYQVGSFTQYANYLLFSLSSYGAFGPTGANRYYFSAAMYGASQILNSSTPKDLALGDMSVKYAIDSCQDTNSSGGCNAGDSRFNTSATVSVDGDLLTRLGTASNGTYYATANAGSTPSVTTSVSVSFAAAETWDCTTSGTWGTVDLTDMANASSALGIDMAACDSAYSYRQDDGSNGYACGAAN